ncbi:MAG TPA: hypothetical protein VD837_06625 [Terriglobales bacterium]|nr:hypothetical protein [Terriglobales bacterium]
MRTTIKTFLAAVVLTFALPMFAQWRQEPTTGSTPMRVPDRTNYAGMTGLGPLLEAEIVDEDANASQKKAVVKAEVWGVDLIAPPQANAEVKRTTAFLTYRLDQQQAITTAQKQYTFSNLPSGDHSITVQLAAANGQPMGAPVVLHVRIE